MSDMVRNPNCSFSQAATHIEVDWKVVKLSCMHINTKSSMQLRNSLKTQNNKILSLSQTGKKAEAPKQQEHGEEGRKDPQSSKSSEGPKDPFDEIFKDPRYVM